MNSFKVTSLSLIFIALLFPASDASGDLQQELNEYFVRLEESFTSIVEAKALRSTNLRQAERLFVRSMKKNIAYNTFLRVNSKGSVVTEVIRGRKVERPMRDVSDQKWFKHVSERKESYYTLVRDDEQGRYYLFWAGPVLKDGDRFVGGVCAKIDLWDYFHEFSSKHYEPFLIKLGRKGLFSHKWEERRDGVEKPIAVKGVEKISVIYFSEEKAQTASVKKDTPSAAATVAPTVVDTAGPEKADAAAKEKKGSAVLLVFFLVILLTGIAVASFMLLAWMRRRAFLKHLDNEDEV